ncbi:hypothetical protein, partial [Clostridium perfringens]
KLLLISLLVLCVSPISTNKIQFIFEYGLFDMFRLKETMMFVPSITLIIIGTYLEYNLKKSLSNKIEVNNE